MLRRRQDLNRQEDWSGSTAEILRLLERVSFTPASRPIRQLDLLSFLCQERTTGCISANLTILANKRQVLTIARRRAFASPSNGPRRQDILLPPDAGIEQ